MGWVASGACRSAEACVEDRQSGLRSARLPARRYVKEAKAKEKEERQAEAEEAEDRGPYNLVPVPAVCLRIANLLMLSVGDCCCPWMRRGREASFPDRREPRLAVRSKIRVTWLPATGRLTSWTDDGARLTRQSARSGLEPKLQCADMAMPRDRSCVDCRLAK